MQEQERLKELDKQFKQYLKSHYEALQNAFKNYYSACYIRFVPPETLTTGVKILGIQQGYFTSVVVAVNTKDDKSAEEQLIKQLNETPNLSDRVQVLEIVVDGSSLSAWWLWLVRTNNTYTRVNSSAMLDSPHFCYADPSAIMFITSIFKQLTNEFIEKRDKLIRYHYELVMKDPATEEITAELTYEKI